MSSPRIWLRCYPSQWNRWKNHLAIPEGAPLGGVEPTARRTSAAELTEGAPLAASGVAAARTSAAELGFFVCESYPDINYARQKRAMDEMRRMGFAANPGMILNIGSHIAEKHKKYTAWTDPAAWADRLNKFRFMTSPALTDPVSSSVYLDLELYDSAGQEHAGPADWDAVQNASAGFATYFNETKLRLVLTQWLPWCVQNEAFAANFANVTWVEESYWSLPDQTEAEATANLAIMNKRRASLRRRNCGYMPQTMQDILRDRCRGRRRMLAAGGIEEVFSWASSRPSDDDVDLLGSEAWFRRPAEPKPPPDPAAMGQMAFDVDAEALPLGVLSHFSPRPGSLTPTFYCRNLLQQAKVEQREGRRAIVFDGSPAQGYSAAFERQLAADHTVAFVGVPPSCFDSNDGTAWMLGRYRVRAAQAPTARWEWGWAWAPADKDVRHVLVCQQTASGGFRMILDGCIVSEIDSGVSNSPDGTMEIGNVGSWQSRPVRMALERLMVFEGSSVDAVTISRQLCQRHGIRWRGEV